MYSIFFVVFLCHIKQIPLVPVLIGHKGLIYKPLLLYCSYYCSASRPSLVPGILDQSRSISRFTKQSLL